MGGLAVTRVIWEIRNVSRRHLRLELPEGAELWEGLDHTLFLLLSVAF